MKGSKQNNKIKLTDSEVEEIVETILDSGLVQHEIDINGYDSISIGCYMDKEDRDRIKPELEKVISRIVRRLRKERIF